MNEELRRRIEARRDEELATIASVAAGAFGSSAAKRQYRAKHKATADALEWVLDLLDAQPAAVSLPTAFVRATTEDGLELWLEHDEGDALVHAGPAPTGSLALFVRGTISLPEEAEPPDCAWTKDRNHYCSAPLGHDWPCHDDPPASAVSLELPEPPRSEHAWMRTNEVVEASGGPAPWTCRRCYKAWNSLDDPQADGGACPGAPAVSLELPQSTKEQS